MKKIITLLMALNTSIAFATPATGGQIASLLLNPKLRECVNQFQDYTTAADTFAEYETDVSYDSGSDSEATTISGTLLLGGDIAQGKVVMSIKKTQDPVEIFPPKITYSCNVQKIK